MPDALDLLKTRRSVKPIEMTGPAPTRSRARHAADHRLARARSRQARRPGVSSCSRAMRAPPPARQSRPCFKPTIPRRRAEQIAFERNRLARAPLVIAVVSRAAPHVKIPEWEQELSAGAAAMNLVTAAHALGFAASWITEWYAYDRARARRARACAEREDRRLRAYRPAGEAAGGSRPRPPLADIVTRFAER